MSVAARDDALVDEELRGRRARHGRLLAGGRTPMVPRRGALVRPVGRRRPGIGGAGRVSSRHAPRRRHRQHEHHASGCSGPARWPRPAGRRPTPRATRRRARAAARRPAAARRRRRSPTSTAIACASVVPSLTAALETVAARRERPLVVADRRAPSRSRSGSTARTRSAPTGSSTRSPRRGSTGRRPSSSTSGPRRPSTASAPTARTSAARSRRASSSASRRSPRGPPSCRGSSCGRPTGRSAATRSARCSRARSSATRRSPPGCSPGSGASWPTPRASTPADVKAILTGGLSAAPWARALEGIDAIDPDLTLKGLAILHAEVSGGEPLELGLLAMTRPPRRPARSRLGVTGSIAAYKAVELLRAAAGRGRRRRRPAHARRRPGSSRRSRSRR